MKTVKQLFIFSTVFLFLLSCKPNEEKINIKKQDKSSIVFKSWLKDTLTVLKNEKVTDYKREIKVSDDSLSMDIIKHYNTNISPNKKNEIKSKELLYALDLLIRNKELPKEKFKIQFIIGLYYSVSMVEQLKYEFDSEVKEFIVIDKKQSIKYKFSKGNLIEKRKLS